MAYTRFDPEDIVISSELVSTPIWTGGLTTITKNQLAAKTSQLIGISSDYFIDIYSNVTISGSEEVQFSIAYGDVDGSGSFSYNSSVPGMTPSRTIYGQYRSLVLGDEDTGFFFGDSNEPASYFWVISIDRARYKERLMVGSGSFNLKFKEAGSNSTIHTLVDDSAITGSVSYIDSGRVYNIRLLNTGSNTLSSSSYGFFLPDIATIILDGKSMVNLIGLNESDVRFGDGDEGHTGYYNAMTLFDNISSLTLKSEETVTSNYIFIRAKNSQFNYSVNPSNITGSGELRHDIMINSPESYITSVGLYNDSNDLLAIAKLSRPLPKNFNKEALIRIKLDY